MTKDYIEDVENEQVDEYDGEHSEQYIDEYDEEFEQELSGEDKEKKEKEIKNNKQLIELVEKAMNGDSSELTPLCAKIIDPVLYRVLRIVRKREDAEDITQEIMLRVCQHIKKLRDPELFRVWLTKIITNEVNRYMAKSNDYNKKLENIDDHRELIDENEANLPMESAVNKEAFAVVLKLIESLPEQQQMVVRLRYYDGMSHSEITKAMNIKKTTVSTHLIRAHEKIKAELEKMSDALGGKVANIVSFGVLMTEFLHLDTELFAFDNAIWVSDVLDKCKTYIYAAGVASAISATSATSASVSGCAATGGAVAGEVWGSAGKVAGRVRCGIFLNE